MTRRHLLATVALAAGPLILGLIAPACLSPTLPLPPPESPSSIGMSVEEGVWDIRGTCTPGATVLIENLQTGVIAGRRDDDNDGRYFIPIRASLCDSATVSEVVGSNTSEGSFFMIEPVENGLSQNTCR